MNWIPAFAGMTKENGVKSVKGEKVDPSASSRQVGTSVGMTVTQIGIRRLSEWHEER
jgi:hypothetical protein